MSNLLIGSAAGCLELCLDRVPCWAGVLAVPAMLLVCNAGAAVDAVAGVALRAADAAAVGAGVTAGPAGEHCQPHCVGAACMLASMLSMPAQPGSPCIQRNTRQKFAVLSLTKLHCPKPYRAASNTTHACLSLGGPFCTLRQCCWTLHATTPAPTCTNANANCCLTTFRYIVAAAMFTEGHATHSATCCARMSLSLLSHGQRSSSVRAMPARILPAFTTRNGSVSSWAAGSQQDLCALDSLQARRTSSRGLSAAAPH